MNARTASRCRRRHRRRRRSRRREGGREKRSGTHDTHARTSRRHESRTHVVGAIRCVRTRCAPIAPADNRTRDARRDEPPTARSAPERPRGPPRHPRRESRGRTIQFHCVSPVGSVGPAAVIRGDDDDDDDNVDDDCDGRGPCVAAIVVALSARLGSARRARHVRGRDRESGLSAHLPQRGPTAAGTGEIAIFGPKIVGASTKAVFQQWWPSTQRASPSCARHLAAAARPTFPFLGRADARRRDATGAADPDRAPTIVPAFSAGKRMLCRKNYSRGEITAALLAHEIAFRGISAETLRRTRLDTPTIRSEAVSIEYSKCKIYVSLNDNLIYSRRMSQSCHYSKSVSLGR